MDRGTVHGGPSGELFTITKITNSKKEIYMFGEIFDIGKFAQFFVIIYNKRIIGRGVTEKCAM